MPLIDTITPDQATGPIAEIYAEVKERFGYVPNAMQLDSQNPAQMARHWGSIKEILAYEGLSQRLFTTIRMLASEVERCEYCIQLNMGLLIEMEGLSQEQVQGIMADPSSAPLDEAEKALLRYVVKVLKDSNASRAEDIQVLRDQGLTDQQIYDALNHGAQQIASDIILNAFKVEPDLH